MDTNQPSHLRTEHLATPLGLDAKRPRLTWQPPEPPIPDARLTAWHIQAATDPDALDQTDLWDSGWVEEPGALSAEVRGKRIPARTRVHWRVRVRWGDRDESDWSEPSWWESGLMSNRAWKGQWIGPAWENTEDRRHPCPLLRHTFHLPAGTVRARLYITARGLYEARINGRAVTDDVLRPGWTDYRLRQPYQTYDVTGLLREGENVLGVTLADGWYAGRVAFRQQVYGTRPSLLGQLEATLTNGRTIRVVTDGTWRMGEGAIRFADLLDGESVDLRMEPSGWDAPGFDASEWTAPRTDPLDAVPLVSTAAPPVRRREELAPKSITPHPHDASAWIVDLGQNIAGWVRLRLPESTPAGTVVSLRHAEMLQPDGAPFYENLRGIRAGEDITTAGGAAGYEPRFTFHGFRYVEVRGVPGELPPNAIRGIAVYSDLAETGQFACSHPLVNQLESNIRWGQKGNFLEIPTDCPQRNERLGWTGDIQVFAGTACLFMDSAAFLGKWLAGLADAQGADGRFPDYAPDIVFDRPRGGNPGWADAGILVPWTLYVQTGDAGILRRMYPSMAKWIEFQQQESTDLIRPAYGYGDWLNVDAFTPLDLLGTAFFARGCELMGRIAGVLGRRGDARRYASLHRRVRRAFQRRFITPDGRMVGDTQTAYAIALRFDLAPEPLRPALVANLVRDIHKGRHGAWPYRARKDHLSTGFLGVNHLLPALTEAGHADLAHQLLLTEDYPSWLFPVTLGATTMWERWDSWHPEKGFSDSGMNSFNHYAYGAIGQWLIEQVAGLRGDDSPDGVGYRRIHVRPTWGALDHPKAITRAEARIATPRGPAASAWRIENGEALLEVTVPPDAEAEVRISCAAENAARVTAGPTDGIATSWADGEFRARASSGHWAFRIPVQMEIP